MTEQLEIRVHYPEAAPTLIYLPGLHGDWTLVGSFRRALAGRLRFVDMTYPRTLEWSLGDYVAGIEGALANHGIRSGWLLGESYGSQLVWPLLERGVFHVEGVVLAGGFVRHPARWVVRVAERITGGISLSLITRILFGYAKVARFRYRHSPEVRESIGEFVARRTELDRQAAKHRLHLIAGNDPCEIARQARAPVYGLSGLWDPVVPWPGVKRWLKRNCVSLRDYKTIADADHNVLGTAPEAAADQIVEWVRAWERGV